MKYSLSFFLSVPLCLSAALFLSFYMYIKCVCNCFFSPLFSLSLLPSLLFASLFTSSSSSLSLCFFSLLSFPSYLPISPFSPLLYLYLYLCNYLYLSFNLSIQLSILNVSHLIHLSVNLSIYLFINLAHCNKYLPLYLSLCLSSHLHINLIHSSLRRSDKNILLLWNAKFAVMRFFFSQKGVIKNVENKLVFLSLSLTRVSVSIYFSHTLARSHTKGDRQTEHANTVTRIHTDKLIRLNVHTQTYTCRPHALKHSTRYTEMQTQVNANKRREM